MSSDIVGRATAKAKSSDLQILPRSGINALQMSKKKKNPHAVALGRLGGLKGGKTRTAGMTPQQRSELGRKAVLARWAKTKKNAQTSE
jgi:hypothetical protein